MTTTLKLRRGTTAQHSSFTGAEGEVTVDTTKDTVVVHDGTTAGGHPLAKSADLGTIASQNSNNVTITGGSITGVSTVTEKTSSTGSAKVPSGTTAQRDGSPAAGYFRFNSSLGKFEGHNGTAWGAVGGGATGGGGDDVFVENGQTVTTNYTLTTNKNAMTVGPLTINSGVTVTVPSGSRWVVI